MAKLEKRLIIALKMMTNPNNFRADPTLETLVYRDRALARAFKLLHEIERNA